MNVYRYAITAEIPHHYEDTGFIDAMTKEDADLICDVKSAQLRRNGWLDADFIVYLWESNI